MPGNKRFKRHHAGDHYCPVDLHRGQVRKLDCRPSEIFGPSIVFNELEETEDGYEAYSDLKLAKEGLGLG